MSSREAMPFWDRFCSISLSTGSSRTFLSRCSSALGEDLVPGVRVGAAESPSITRALSLASEGWGFPGTDGFVPKVAGTLIPGCRWCTCADAGARAKIGIGCAAGGAGAGAVGWNWWNGGGA